MNIIFITQLLPYPVRSGGKYKTYSILRQLAAKHQVYVACFHDSPGNTYLKWINHLKQDLGLANIVSFFRPQVTAPINKMWMLVPTTILSRKPFIITKYFDQRLANYLDQLSSTITVDRVYLDHDTSFQYLPYIHRQSFTKVIYDEHNVNSVAMWRNVTTSKRGLIYRLLYLWDYVRFSYYEKLIVVSVDAIATISPQDRRLLINRGAKPTRTYVLPLPLSSQFDPTTTTSSTPIVTFIGVLSWAPNRFGFHWFYQHVWPKIVQKLPQAKLFLIGSRITDDTLAMIHHDPSVNYLGEVADLDYYYQQTGVIIVPIFMGSGIRIKLLDAMAHGQAIVSTTVGAEGVVTPKSARSAGIILADNPQKFADSVIRLLTDNKLRQKNAVKALKYIQTHYSPTKTQIILDRLLT